MGSTAAAEGTETRDTDCNRPTGCTHRLTMTVHSDETDMDTDKDSNCGDIGDATVHTTGASCPDSGTDSDTGHRTSGHGTVGTGTGSATLATRGLELETRKGAAHA